PITAASVPTDPFMLAGFERRGGSPLLLGTADAVAVPEPPMLALVVAGFILLLVSRSRRRAPLSAFRAA
ncbi:MAG: PEP-CTERM sorting domain-containing protein, partial [Gammaproteobacteria bacterium]